MTCGACKLAEIRPGTGHFLSGCRDCDVRRLAKTSRGFVASMAAGKFRDDYTAELKSLVGEDPAELDKLHQEVRAWDKRIRGEA